MKMEKKKREFDPYPPYNALLLELLYDELRRTGCSWCNQYAGIVKSATYCPKCRRRLRDE